MDNKKSYGFALILLFCFLWMVPGYAQFSGDDIPTVAQGQEPYDNSDTTTLERSSIFDIFTGKPGKAAFYSLIIPGGGQYYNRRYWKIPLVVGAEVAAFWWLFSNNNSYNKWQNGYLQLLNNEIESFQGITTASRAKLVRDGFLKQREYSYLIVIGAHLFNVFEAFIDRHLIDFDVDDDLSFQPLIEPRIGASPTLGISVAISLNGRKQSKKPWFKIK